MIYSIKKRLDDESGVILMASTMGIFIILSIFAFYLARFSVIETRTGGYYAQDIKARNLALTGLEHGIQNYKQSKDLSPFTGRFNNGSYTFSFDSQTDQSGSSLSREQYLSIKSVGYIDDVERNVRLIISSIPEAFCFSFYGFNSSGQTFNNAGTMINGDMFFKGNVGENSGSVTGITYTSSGNGGTLLSSYPSFPEISTIQYDAFLDNAANAPSSYNNYGLTFNGSNNCYMSIGNSNEINTGNNHTQKTIEAWFKVSNIGANKQVIYEQGGTVRGLNIYVHQGALYVGGWNEPGGESGWQGTWLSSNQITSNKWHHVALTLEGGSQKQDNAFKGYLDGQLFGSGIGSKLWSHPGDVCVGRSGSTKFHTGDDGGQRYFNGSIDEVRLWNTVRTQQQILSKMDTILIGNEYGLSAYYELQQDDDDSQNQSNNDGTRRGASSYSTGPSLSKMGSSSFENKIIDLSTYDNNTLLINSNLTISSSTVNGPGYIVADGDITISANTVVNGEIFIISNGSLTVNNSQIGINLSSPSILYSNGNSTYSGSILHGLVVSKGNSLSLNNTNLDGAILNYSSFFSLSGDSDIIGSVVSKYSVDLQGNGVSITRGDIPEFTDLNIGLDPFIVPGSYLEF